MAVQFSLSYDANGDPVLVENTATGIRKVVSTSPVVSEFRSRFETPSDNITEEPEIIDNPVMEYINEMEKNADGDINLSFIEKQGLQMYTPEAIAARETPLSKVQSLFQTAVKAAMPTNIKTGIALLNVVAGFLPKESPEIKAIKQYYATPEIANLVEEIPGMKNYNLVYGGFPGISEAGYGLAGAAAKRQSVIDKTLANKYGLTPEEIAQTKLGTYKGPVSSDLIDRNKKLQDLQDKEKEEIATNPAFGNVPNPVVNLTPEQKDFFRNGGGGQDSGNQGGGSPTGTNRPGGPNRPDDAGSSSPTNVGNPFGY